MQHRARDTAQRLLNRHGGPADLVRVTSSQATPWDEGGTTTALLPVQMVETGATEDTVGGTLIETGDIVGVMIPEGGVVPALSDKLRLRGHDHALVELQPVQPDPSGPVIHWRFQARR